MASTLFIRIGNPELNWLLLDSQGNASTSGAGDAETFSSSGITEDFDGSIVIIVPGEDVLLTSAQVPSKQYRQILQAVPFVVEEQLAMDVEDCFFALGGRAGTGEVEVAVVSRVTIEDWIDQCKSLGIASATMILESGLVPATAGVSGLIEGNRVHLNWQVGKGITTSRDDMALAISLIPEDARASIDLYLQAEAQEKIDIQLSELIASESEPPVVHHLDEPPFVWMCQRFDGSQINLLQGEYKVEESRSRKTGVWRSVAILCACAVLLHLATLVGQGVYLDQQANAYESATVDLYKKTFPADKNVRDLRRRWDSHLGRSEKSDALFIGLFAQSATGLTGAGLTLTNVNFNESRGDLILQVGASRSEELVQYAQKLTSEGLNAEIGTISQEDGTVRGSIKVRAPGGNS